MSNSKQT